MTKQLRDYQQAAIEAIENRFAAGVRRQLLSAATGAGKTEIAAFLIKKMIARGENCLFVAHRDRLVSQAADRIEGIVGPGLVGIVNGSKKEWWSQCVVATVQSAANEGQLARAPNFKNLIIDECHRSRSGSYKKVIDALLAPDGLLLGITATPNRSDKKGLIPDPYQELVYEVGMQPLIDQGFLCRMIGKEIKLPIDFSKIKTAISTDGIRDYRPEDVKNAFEEAKWLERITVGWQEVASDRKTIVFVPPGIVDGRGCGMAHSLAEYMRLQGIRAAAVDGKTRDGEQDQIIADFTHGLIQVLINVNIFTEGLDLPGIECVLFARPTQSSIIYSQAIGRGSRIFPGKENCLVIDVTGITDQLAAEGQSLMTLGRILPTEEQIETERAARWKAAKALIRKLWAKRVTLKLNDGKIQVLGEIKPGDLKKLTELTDEIIGILAERDHTSEDQAPGAGERKPVNTNLLSSNKIEIRDLDFVRAGIQFIWNFDIPNKRAFLRHEGIAYELWRDDLTAAEPYGYADMTTIGGLYGRAATGNEAKAAVECHAAGVQLRKRAALDNPDAAWRNKLATDSQKNTLRKFKIPFSDSITAGEASNRISAAIKRHTQKRA